MNIGLIGSGGREHALCKKIHESKLVNKIICFPGNAGTSSMAENVNIDLNDFEKIKDFVLIKKIDLVVIGPEKPLVDGITDYLEGFAQAGVVGSAINLKSDDKCNSFGAYKLIGA